MNDENKLESLDLLARYKNTLRDVKSNILNKKIDLEISHDIVVFLTGKVKEFERKHPETKLRPKDAKQDDVLIVGGD